MSAEELDLPSLPSLIAEEERLSDDLRAGRERFANSQAFLYPLNCRAWWPPQKDIPGLIERPAGVQGVSEDMVAGVLWINHLKQYCQHLKEYFVDWLKKPEEELKRFPMVEYVRTGFFGTDPMKGRGPLWQTFTGDQCILCLHEHRRLLLMEQEKQRVEWHFEFRSLLHEAMNVAGHDISSAANDMGIDRKTLGSYLNATTYDLKPASKTKMGNYICTHIPRAKERVRLLLGR
jgi:hypothetical protein